MNKKLAFAAVTTLSLSRVPLGFGIYFAAVAGDWQMGFWLIIAALVTDWVDGPLARHFGVASKAGQDLLDPIPDLFLTLGIVIGLWQMGFLPVWVLVAGGAIGAMAKTFGVFSPKGSAARWIGNMVVPFGSVTILAASIGGYAVLAYGSPMLGVEAVGGAILLYAKFNRVQSWIHEGHDKK